MPHKASCGNLRAAPLDSSSPAAPFLDLSRLPVVCAAWGRFFTDVSARGLEAAGETQRGNLTPVGNPGRVWTPARSVWPAEIQQVTARLTRPRTLHSHLGENGTSCFSEIRNSTLKKKRWHSAGQGEEKTRELLFPHPVHHLASTPLHPKHPHWTG